MKKHYFSLIIILTCLFLPIAGNPVISFYFKADPDTAKLTAKLKYPGKIAKHTIHGITEHPIISGICATYAGYVATSDHNGEIIFPRKHRADAVDIIVTRGIEPVSLSANTIQHWKLVPEEQAKLYSLTEQYDEKTKQYYWKTQQMPLPADLIIPLTAIVIIAKPSQITVPLGENRAIKTANLVLPSVFVKKGINIISNSTYFLTIRHLFRPVETAEQRTPLRLTTHLVN